MTRRPKGFLEIMIAGTVVAFALAGCNSEEKQADGAGRPAAGLVARQDYETAKAWQPPKVMDRDFWHILGVSQDTQPDSGNWAGTYMRELVNKPLFKESGLNFGCVNNITVPGSNKVSIAAMDPRKYLELIEARPNAPFFIEPPGVRPVYRLMRHFECDNEGYQAWKKAHPNFMGCINGETCNDFRAFAPWGGWHWEALRKDLDKELTDTITREFPKPENRDELTSQFMKGCKAYRDFFFNNSGKACYMQEANCVAHCFHEASAGIGWIETTNTGCQNGSLNYRHQNSLFFIRGASRQYGGNWAWYIAVYYNGYDDQGKFSGNNLPDYRVDRAKPQSAGGAAAPGYGMSVSLLTRDMYLAYLSGASFVQHEYWQGYLRPATKDKGAAWDLSSPFGKAWESWFDFTRKNPARGTCYTPVALLAPFEQGYPIYGGKSWQMFNYERRDWMLDAFMFTIIPHSPVTRKGDEGALSNSPYGDIYDVVVPNTPKGPVSIDVLNNYKVAVMLGGRPKSKALADRLMEYVENGGTLLLNIKQVNEFFPEAFLGFATASAPEATVVEVRSPVRALSDGKTFTLSEKYELEKVRIKGAAPLLEDAVGNVLACKNGFGKGNVIVSTVDFMVPKNNMAYQQWDVLDKMVYGKEFPFVEYFLENIVREVLPLEVKGDIEYGLNRLDDGWLLYLINNKGVTKHTNKEQVLDMSKTARVEVILKNIKATSVDELRERKAVPLA